jgi:hypothetical protein
MARACASECISQIRELQGRPLDVYVAELVTNAGADTVFMQELVAFAGGACREQLTEFDTNASEFELMRVNELSVERLHAKGSQEVIRGKNISAATQSFALRRKQIFDLGCQADEHLFRLSQACQGLAGQDFLIKKFQLENHPEIQKYLTKSTARGKESKLYNVPHKLVRHVFYHIDSYSLYHVQGELQAAITDQRAQDCTERSARAIDPLKDARLDTASDEAKVHALSLKAALEHFKDIDTFTH